MSATLATRPDQGPTSVRVTPVPRLEPPTDDERATYGLPTVPVAAPLLPLQLPGSGVPRPRPPRRSASSALGRAARSAVAVAVAVAEVRGSDLVPLRMGGETREHLAPTSMAVVAGRPSLSDAGDASGSRAATRRFIAICVEVIGGFRPVGQLRPYCMPEHFAEISERLTGPPVTGPAGRSRGAASFPGRTPVVGRATGGPPRGGRAERTGPVDRVMVRHVQICEVGDSVVEVAVVLARREQIWAMALRLEVHRGRWLCRCVEVL